MPRAIVMFVVALLALACPLSSSAVEGHAGAMASSGKRAATVDPGRITLRLRYRVGPWQRSLYLKLVRTRLSSFSICAIRNWDNAEKFSCEVPGAGLPEGANLRLEQSPIARALKRADSPNWGMLGISATERLGAVLSNTVSGNRVGVVYYRVTMRDGSGQLLASSNKVRVIWHR